MKRTRLRRARTTDRAKMKRKLEKLSKEIVRLRDKSICQHTGKLVDGVNRQCSHVIPVSADGRLAFDPENMKILCYHSHLNWWHKNPIEAGEWFVEKFPERNKSLREKHLANKVKGTIKMWEYEEMEENLTAQLKELQKNA